MKSLTAFANFSKHTNQSFFVVALFLLRVAFGAMLIIAPFFANELSYVLGALLIIGLLVRPVATSVIALFVFSYLTDLQNLDVYPAFDIVMVVVMIVFLSGGVGHIYGLDGLIYRTTKKRKLIKALLFG